MSGSRDHLLDSAYNDLCEGVDEWFEGCVGMELAQHAHPQMQ